LGGIRLSASLRCRRTGVSVGSRITRLLGGAARVASSRSTHKTRTDGLEERWARRASTPCQAQVEAMFQEEKRIDAIAAGELSLLQRRNPHGRTPNGAGE